ncbi:histidine kinase [Bradyrhizobium sp. CCBAU 051011]|uniref:GAF domain-containing protein n=1 Tax=Bradyrhizobium sp. CCBAU 051011 TaxID=858422 RepID=UPI0013743AC8|nr:GAF domain-containing protein [Bradyrhizobium sp. CCBAU 051011]QHO75198.1 histidine kinase [Bradyrhizobium sp. CCBAU 051011]
MATLPEDMSVAIDELGSAITEMESHLESVRAERDEAKARQVELEIENANLRRELNLAREQQKASAGILSVISSSVADTKPVFESILSSIKHLFDSEESLIFLTSEEGLLQIAAARGANAEAARERFPIPIEGTVSELAIRERRLVRSADVQNDPDVPIDLRETARRIGQNYSMAIAPMLWEDKAIGTVFVGRTSMVPFTDRECELLNSFADQAVIAIQNARLFDETREALERQTATADILKVIASSPSEVQPVLDVIVNSAAELFAPHTAVITTLQDGKLHWRAIAASGPSFDHEKARSIYPIPFDPDRSPSCRAIMERRIIEIPDIEAPGTPELTRRVAAAGGFRSATFVPLIHRGEGIGTINLTTPQAGFRLSEKQLTLVRTFADQAVIAIENTRLFNETRETLERQTATADILKVIASSPSDVQPVFEAIASSAKTLLGAFSTTVLRFIGDELHLVAYTPTDPKADEVLQSSFPRPLAEFPTFALVRNGETIQFPDTEADDVPPANRELARLRGFRSVLFTPLMNQGTPVGIISVTRAEPGAFAPHHVQLLQTFADQAVIAIENTRLFNETKEALERQTATADILKVIASSPSDVQPVFDAIAYSANRLIGGFSAAVFRYTDGRIHLAAFTPTDAAGDAVLQSAFPVPLDKFPPYQLTRKGAPAELPDTELEPAARDIARARGYRSMLFAPLMNDGEAVGIITVTRVAPGPFGEQHTRLLQMFADQAVIAIKNVGLFNEVQQRTEDLSEALQQQTATAEVLKVIASSPTEVRPALQAIVESACKFCDAYDANVLLKIGNDLHFSAHHGPIPTGQEARPINRDWATGRSVVDRVPVQVSDFQAPEAAEFPEGQRQSREQGHRCTLSVPLLREGEAIGAIVLRRLEPVAFSDKQIGLLQTFADQAVIAIGNVRLFEEVQAKTRELSEALTYQTGSANILKVIASSPTDVAPVLTAIVESACELCDANDAIVYLKEGDHLSYEAHHGPIPVVFGEKRAINRDYVAGRSVVDRTPVHVRDVFSEEGAEFPEARELSQSLGIRSILCAPMLRENESIGAILLRRTEVHPFTDKQISLLQTFADQAVIAIGNVRLFEEVQAKTRDLEESLQQQTATADVLRVISASPGELEPVFHAMLENAGRLCEAKFAMLRLLKGDQFHGVAAWNLPPAFSEFLAQTPIRVDPKLPLGRVVTTKQPVHVHDVLQHEAYLERYPGMIALAEIGGGRTLLQVPMLKEDQLVGTIGLYRQEVRPFTEKQIALVQNFAAQAVIAIENARLLNELRQRTSDLSQSLDDLRTAQNRLVQTEKLASLGQLTAGIAHEIKNPLNFVNNFAALSAELTEELHDALGQAEVGEKIRAEVDELTELLKGNLKKVVQHGKRADSIVKNMLLHSREGGGEHRLSDINALIDESLNLAYHGARAEKPGFNVTLERDFDPAAGQIDVFPQEITRVFLNLVSNGFHAVTKRNKEGGEPGFEPRLRASTKNLGESVEIRIRDNGTGIPPEVKEKMFNPFFTTKPAGEGTGLGLSMSHDIIVKQHGGTIDVDTQPGHFTEFRILLPRASNFAERSRG